MVLALTGCTWDRPIHPLRFEGYPGAPIEDGFFPLRDGMRWTFEDRLAENGRELVMELRRAGEGYELTGAKQGAASLRWSGGFLEVVREGELVDRPLRSAGRVGEPWEAAGARCMAFGYDRLEVLGEERRALVVAVERGAHRDLYWFVAGTGWVRIRTERRGRAVRDALLTGFSPGTVN